MVSSNFKILKRLSLIAFAFMVSSCGVTIKVTETDDSLLSNINGTINITSLNSAHQVNIVRTVLDKDTLFVDYKRGTFCKSNNVLKLNDSVKFIKCAKKLFRVEKKQNSYQIVEVN
jgi:hypothetical protein